MKDTFSKLHPVVNFLYFTTVIIFSMFFMHPVLLLISLLCSTVYSVYLNGIKAIKFILLYILPMVLVVTIVNIAFNNGGLTVLTYIKDTPITLEAILYGMASGTMLATVILWFSCYNVVMTSDKFIFLFGKIIPAISLILSMVLRFVPKIKAQIKVVSNAQKCVGRDVSNGNIFSRAKNGVKIISILMTWAFENAIDTADSMRCRGYGLKCRTTFAIYKLDNRDKVFFLIISILNILIFMGLFLGENTANYFPIISVKEISAISYVIYAGYALLLLIPPALNIMEDIKWYHLKSRI